MKYIHKLLFLSLILLVLSGCGSGSNSDNIDSNWKTGTEGISLKFLDNSPPSTIYAGDENPLVLEVRNLGNYPDNDDDDLGVTLFFTGFDRNQIVLDYKDKMSIRGGKTQTRKEGGLEYYETNFDTYLYDEASSTRQPIKVTACYPYKTAASIDVCVDPNPIKNDEDSCDPGYNVGLGSQAAPIAITDINQESLKGKVRFTITVKNVGPGTVFSGSSCINPEVTDKNIVYVESVYLGREKMDCLPFDKIRLSNGKGIITCTLDSLDDLEPAYKTSLGVHLAYNYKNSITKEVTIKRIE